MPHYDLPSVDRGPEPDVQVVTGQPLPEEIEETATAQPALFPPGPLAEVSIVPRTVDVIPGGERRVYARAVDAHGRAIRGSIEFRWTVEGDGFAVVGEGPRPAVTAAGGILPSARGLLTVEAHQGSRTESATCGIVVAEPRDLDRGGPGIPKPELVDAPGGSWRSRIDGGSWQVNAGHEDYIALDENRARLRYIVALLGKEIVLRTYNQPGAGELLEHLIAVLAHAERNLRA
jgi:hypothetical protein